MASADLPSEDKKSLALPMRGGITEVTTQVKQAVEGRYDHFELRRVQFVDASCIVGE